MNCAAVEGVLTQFVDDELDAATHAAVVRHAAACEACTEAIDELRVVRQLVRSFAMRYSGSPALRAALTRPSRLQALRMRVAAAGRSVAVLVFPRRRLAALAACATLAVAVGIRLAPPSPGSGMAAEVVASHVRAVMSDRLVEVATDDAQGVQPWFRGRLHFAPRLGRVEPAELRLLGARTDYVRQQLAGAVVYEAGRHYVTVFVWPSQDARRSPRPIGRVRGYNLVNWAGDGLFYCAVSDMDADRLYRVALRLGGAR